MRPEKTIRCLADLPEMPGTIDTMTWNRTGSWRFLAPTPLRRTPPCQAQCPAGIPIPEFIRAIREERTEAALRIIMDRNPLPGLTGRLCYHPCQTGCVRRELDQNVLIQQLERFAADTDCTGPRVAGEAGGGLVGVIGTGPFGLACAHFLRAKGRRVVLMDVNDRPGGALLGIDPEKLDPGVVEREISRLIKASGLDVRLNQGVSPEVLPDLCGMFAVLILDPTAAGLEDLASAFPATFNPLEDEGPGGAAFRVTLPERLLPFKPPLISHYIGAARLTADQICALSAPAGAGDMAEEAVPVDREQIRLDYFQKAGPLEAGKPGGPAWTADRAREAAGRCLSCGVCNQCGQCELFCPDQSIRVAGNGVELDLFHCKGCGICANECPRGVITMEYDSI